MARQDGQSRQVSKITPVEVTRPREMGQMRRYELMIFSKVEGLAGITERVQNFSRTSAVGCLLGQNVPKRRLYKTTNTYKFRNSIQYIVWWHKTNFGPSLVQVSMSHRKRNESTKNDAMTLWPCANLKKCVINSE